MEQRIRVSELVWEMEEYRLLLLLGVVMTRNFEIYWRALVAAVVLLIHLRQHLVDLDDRLYFQEHDTTGVIRGHLRHWLTT